MNIREEIEKYKPYNEQEEKDKTVLLKYLASHLHLDCCFLLEADENKTTRIKADENSGVKWINIEDATKITNEEVMIPIYDKLNKKLYIL